MIVDKICLTIYPMKEFLMTFHEERFPADISMKSSGGPERKTSVVTLGSGYEERNSTWADSRRRYNCGYGIKNVNDLHTVIAFFEARSGRLHAFRWKDWSDYKSCAPTQTVANTDQFIGTGNGVTKTFQLAKTYFSGANNYSRIIKKPLSGSINCALGGTPTAAFAMNATTGIVTFTNPPGNGVIVTAGFEFDVPVRFDTDYLDVTLEFVTHGLVQTIPIVEVRI